MFTLSRSPRVPGIPLAVLWFTSRRLATPVGRIGLAAVITVLSLLPMSACLAQESGNPYWEGAKFGYEVAKWYKEHYDAAEAERTAIKLESNNRPEITPDVFLRVSENNRCRLPNVKATTTVTWIPFEKEGLPTRITGEWLINGVPLGEHTETFRGHPSRKQWQDWFSDEGPYPYAADYSNDNKQIIFDMVTNGEAFYPGLNTIAARLRGTTYIEKNVWGNFGLNWFALDPVEKVDFNEVLTQTKDLSIDIPYKVYKTPPDDVIQQSHPLDVSVGLWDTNLAQAVRQGNNQHYVLPTVTTPQADGDLPPDNGTSNNLRLVARDERTHTGPNHPDLIHVQPDFDPILIGIVHREWDLPELAGSAYRVVLSLHKTEPWCKGTASPDSTPGGAIPQEQKQSSMWATPDYWLKYRTVVEGDTLASVASTAAVYLQDTLGYYQPFDSLQADVDGEVSLARQLPAGRTFRFDFAYRDRFGQHFASSITTSTPLDSINPVPVRDLGVISLALTSQETVTEASHAVDIVACDISGVAFGKITPIASFPIHYDFGTGSQAAFTNQHGEATFAVPDGQSLQISSPGTPAFLPIIGLPSTPPILKPMTVSGTGTSIQDDRIPLFLSPSFYSGPVSPVDLSIRPTPRGDSLVVQGVTDLDLKTVSMVDLLVAGTGGGVGTTTPLPWGEAGQRFAYQPLKLEFGSLVSSGLRDSLIQHGLELVFHQASSDIRVTLQIVYDPTGVNDEVPSAPNRLEQNRPNPFNPITTIPYTLAGRGRVIVRVFDISGRCVRKLVDAIQDPGHHQVVWTGELDSGEKASSSVYFYEITYPDGTSSARRMTILR